MTDPLCTCPPVQLQANRRDRRSALRRGAIPATRVTRHRRECPLRAIAARSDPERGHK